MMCTTDGGSRFWSVGKSWNGIRYPDAGWTTINHRDRMVRNRTLYQVLKIAISSDDVKSNVGAGSNKAYDPADGVGTSIAEGQPVCRFWNSELGSTGRCSVPCTGRVPGSTFGFRVDDDEIVPENLPAFAGSNDTGTQAQQSKNRVGFQHVRHPGSDAP